MSGSLVNRSKFKLDLGLLLSGLAVLLLVGIFGNYDYSHFINLNPPFEDASMLFKYAKVLASGGGISWNLGQSPGVTDGATDLGFVALLAIFVHFGVTVVRAAAIINLIAIFGLGYEALVFIRKFSRFSINPITVLVLVTIGCGPLDRFLKSGFSPGVIGLLYLIGVGLILTTSFSDVDFSRRRVAVAGTLAGISGWWRPEGFFFSVLFGLSAVCTVMYFMRIPFQTVTKKSIWYFFPYLFLLALWCIFRVSYFGHLLPTSAVMKAEAGFHLANFPETFYFLLLGIAPVLLYALLRLTRELAIYLLFILTTITILSASWIPIATTLDWWHRMQWPLIPPLLILLAFAIQKSGRETPSKKINLA